MIAALQNKFLQSWHNYPLQYDILKTIRENTELRSAPTGALFFLPSQMDHKAAAEQPDIPALRQKITDLVAQNAVAMVQCAIDSVREEGHYQAIKYLFEMIGLYPASAANEDVKQDSLAEILMKQLDLGDSDMPGSGPDR